MARLAAADQVIDRVLGDAEHLGDLPFGTTGLITYLILDDEQRVDVLTVL